jgi:HPt (histidine-containing phosphotransfer) domain-containing protein
VPAPNLTVVLDREQLRDVTLNDDELMREALGALIDDTTRQIPLLQAAIRAGDAPATLRLAHYSKGACANLGAKAAAATLLHIERSAASGDFTGCAGSLANLAAEIERLRAEEIPG